MYQTCNSSSIRNYDRDQLNEPESLPNFVQQPVISKSDVLEGEPVYIEAHLTSTRDSTLKIDWMKNGQLVGTGKNFLIFLNISN